MARGFKRFAYFGDHLYVWALIWAFNPASLKPKALIRLERCQIWISREALLRQYGRQRQVLDDRERLLRGVRR